MLIRSIYGETPEGAVPVEDRGPNKEAFRQAKQVGVGPQQREMRKAFRQAKQVGWAPTDRLSKRKPSDKASWGG